MDVSLLAHPKKHTWLQSSHQLMQLPGWFSDSLDVWESGLRLMQLQIESKTHLSGRIRLVFQVS